MPAVNQALGRCIRHLGDYGALFLVDSRYSSRKSQLARWLRSHFVVHDSYRDMKVELGLFFDNVPQKLKDQAREAARKKNGGGGGDTAATAVVLVSSSESSSEAPNSSPAVANVATATAAAGTSQPSQNAPADGSDPMDLDESV